MMTSPAWKWLLRHFFAVLLASLTPCAADDLQRRWETQASGVTTSIRALCAVDENTCWFGTAGGTIGRTTDGGKTWNRSIVKGAEDVEFRDLEALDANHCLAMSVGEGKASRIYQSRDGGETWNLVFQNQDPKGFFNGMAFWDEQNGILAGDPVNGHLVILRTSNGGTSWQAMPNTPKMRDGEHAFAASGTHLTVAAGGHVWVGSGGKVARVFYSGDFGKSWTTLKTPMISGEPSTGIFSLAFHDPLNGFAVGGNYEKESEGERNAIVTSDGGKTWTLLKDKDGQSVFPFRSCVRIDPDSKAIIAIGPEGSNVSRDHGKTWKPFGDQGFHTFSIGGSTTAIWAAGSNGRIARLR